MLCFFTQTVTYNDILKLAVPNAERPVYTACATKFKRCFRLGQNNRLALEGEREDTV